MSGTISLPQRAPSRRFEEVAAYRGLAALLLVIFHAYLYVTEVVPGAPPLVDNLLGGLRISGWFFTLSGFLLFLPFARAALAGTSAPRWRTFLTRRARRIIPAYYIALLTLWLLTYQSGVAHWQDLALHLTFLHTLSAKTTHSIITPAWSLSLEAIFYVALALGGPPLCALCRRGGTATARRVLLLTPLVGALGASVAYKGVAFAAIAAPEQVAAYFSFPANLDCFALGMILAVAVADGRLACCRRTSAIALGLGLGGFLALCLLAADSALATRYYHVLASAAFTLVLAATVLARQRPGWVRHCAGPLPRALSAISFSLFLWHQAILTVLINLLVANERTIGIFPFIVAGVALSLLAATAGYLLIERPFIRRWSPAPAPAPHPHPAGLAVAVGGSD